jgi:hypothetical protein
MKLLGVATNYNTYLYEYEDAAKRLGWDYKFLGMGQEWTGFLNYQKWVLAELELLPENELVMITDTYDVLVQKTPAETERIFRNEFTAPIVVGAEAACATGATCYEPAAYLCAPHDTDPVMWPNTGMMIGETKDLTSLFQFAVDNGFNDDQRAAGAYWATNCELLELDRDSKLVYNWGFAQRADVVEGKPQLKKPKSDHVPAVIHTFAQEFDLGLRSRKMRKVILGTTTTPLLGSLTEWGTKLRKVVFQCKEMQSYWVPFIVGMLFILLIIVPIYILMLRQRRNE